MPVQSMEELAAVEVGQKIETNEVPYWRTEEGWWGIQEAGASVIRDKFFSGFVAEGKVLGPGEILFKPGLVYYSEDGSAGPFYGILIEPSTESGKWKVYRFLPDGSPHPKQQDAEQAKVREKIMENQPPAGFVNAVLKMRAEKVALEAQVTEQKAAAAFQAKEAGRAVTLIEAIQTAMKEVVEFEPATYTTFNPSGLKVDDHLRTRADFNDLPVGTVIEYPENRNRYTKQTATTWFRTSMRGGPGDNKVMREEKGQFAEPEGYVILSLPAAPDPTFDPVTGLRVGDRIANQNQLDQLPVGAVMTSRNGYVFTKADPFQWRRDNDGATYRRTAFSNITNYTLTSLPTPQPAQSTEYVHPGTGLKVGDLVPGDAEFRALPVGTEVTYEGDGTPWKKFQDGQWDRAERTSGSMVSLAPGRNRITVLPRV